MVIRNYIYLVLIFSGLIAQLTVQAQICPSDNICLNEGDAFIGFDRKDWTSNFSDLSEGYLFSFPLDEPDCNCTVIDQITITIDWDVNFNNIDANLATPPGTCYFEDYVNIGVCDDTSPMSCPTDNIFREGPWPFGGLTFNNGPIDFSFGNILSVDLFPLVSSGCPNDRDVISQGFYDATISICIDITYKQNTPEDILSLPDEEEYCFDPNEAFEYDAPNDYEYYEWFDDNGDLVFEDDRNDFDVALPGDYTLFVTDEAGCIQEDAIEFIPYPEPSIEYTLPNPYTGCGSGNDTLFAIVDGVTNNSDYNYTWTLPNGDELDVDGLPLTESGTYSLELSSLVLQCDFFDSYTYEVIQNSTARITTLDSMDIANASICTNDDLMLTGFVPSTDMTFYNYTWINGTDTTRTQNIDIINGGTYYLIMQDTLGCPPTIDSVMITAITPLNAGDDNTTEACPSVGLDLNTALSTNSFSGGIWMDALTNQVISAPNNIDASSFSGIRDYLYIIANAIPCAADTANISISFPSLTSCNDNNDCTINDMGSSLSDGTVCIPCTGTPYECCALLLNIGDACDDNDPNTVGDTVDPNCNCVGQLTFDCPTLMLNIGASCDDNDLNTINDIVDANCNCVGELAFDCPVLMLNIGDGCDDNDLNTINDIVDANCNCVGELAFDCPMLMLNIGDLCDDNDPNTINDIVDANCDCVGELAFDCPMLMLNIGDGCDDNDINTINDIVDANCNCVGELAFDCPVLMLNIGDGCDDNDINTINDIIDASCNCVGQPAFDCPALMLNIGDNCDDNDINTINDTVDANCNCIGDPAFDCPALMLNIGEACDDNDPNTVGDIVDANCNCVGQIDFDCPTLMLNIGASCDDNNSDTVNDIVDSNCICIGEPAFDCLSLMLNIGDNCDDNDPTTINDLIDSNCNCIGEFDCSVGIEETCDDNDDCTTNDMQVTLPDGTICEPCRGQTVDCTSGTTMEVACDDGNDSTENDVQTILLCDESICIPCAGIVPTTRLYIPNVIALGEVGDDEFRIFGNQDAMIIDFKIYDRWGQLVHSVANVTVNDPSLTWNGRKNDALVQQGIYIYRIEYRSAEQIEVEFGELTVIR